MKNNIICMILTLTLVPALYSMNRQAPAQQQATGVNHVAALVAGYAHRTRSGRRLARKKIQTSAQKTLAQAAATGTLAEVQQELLAIQGYRSCRALIKRIVQQKLSSPRSLHTATPVSSLSAHSESVPAISITPASPHKVTASPTHTADSEDRDAIAHRSNSTSPAYSTDSEFGEWLAPKKDH